MTMQDDPFGPSPDATVIRPRPGAGRKPGGAGVSSSVSASASPRSGDERSRRPATGVLLGLGLNPLLRAASPVLLLIGKARTTPSGVDADALRRDALDEIRSFEDHAEAQGVPRAAMTGARYALCAALDEAVLSTGWGAESSWSQHSLLLELHREAQGGRKFFDVLDGISADPHRHIDLMELYYVCLALGFAGKYETLERGRDKLATIQHEVHRQIQAVRGAHASDLSLRWRGLEDRRNPIVRYSLWRVVGAVTLIVLTLSFLAYRFHLGQVSAPVLAELDRVGRDAHLEPRIIEPTPGPTLRELLAPEEQAGEVRVEEYDGRTRVIVVASDLFASGNARINSRYDDMLQRVALAIDQVPGAVLVEGHTDSQPIRTARYPSNTELSKDRALGVADVLRSVLTDPLRVEEEGRGAMDPRVQPGSAPENRRVEIVHTPPPL